MDEEALSLNLTLAMNSFITLEKPFSLPHFPICNLRVCPDLPYRIVVKIVMRLFFSSSSLPQEGAAATSIALNRCTNSFLVLATALASYQVPDLAQGVGFDL